MSELQTEGKKLIAELKCNELKLELEKLGLDKNGVKAVLIERLEKALQSKELIVTTQKEEENELFIDDTESTINSDNVLSESDALKNKTDKPVEENVSEIDKNDLQNNTLQNKDIQSPNVGFLHNDYSVNDKFITPENEDNTNKEPSLFPEASINENEIPKKSLPNNKENDASVWVRGISNTTKAADLRALFIKHGKVQTAKIFTTKNKLSPTCFGFITMHDPSSADMAIQKLNRTNLKGKVITAEKANESLLSLINRTTKTSNSTTNNTLNTSDNNEQNTVQHSITNLENVKNLNTNESKPIDNVVNFAKPVNAVELMRGSKRSSSPEIIILDSEKAKNVLVNQGSTKNEEIVKKIISTKSSSQASKIVKLPISKKIPTTKRPKGGPSYEKSSSHRSARAIVASSRRYITSNNRGRAAITSTNNSRFDRNPNKPSIKITKTSTGIHVSTRRNFPESSREYNISSYGYDYKSPKFGDSARNFSSRSRKDSRSSPTHRSRSSRANSISNSEREQMLRLMRRREDEHRKKEEELRFQREKEKLRFERERLEREKLEVQQLKLTAQLAKAQYAAFLNPVSNTSAGNSGGPNFTPLLTDSITLSTSDSNRGLDRNRTNLKSTSSKKSYKESSNGSKDHHKRTDRESSSHRSKHSINGISSTSRNPNARGSSSRHSNRPYPITNRVSPIRRSDGKDLGNNRGINRTHNARGSGSRHGNRPLPYPSTNRISPIRRNEGKDSGPKTRDADFYMSGVSAPNRELLSNEQYPRTDPSYASRIASFNTNSAINTNNGMFSASTGIYGRDSLNYGGSLHTSNSTYRDPLTYTSTISNQWSNSRNYEGGASTYWPPSKNESLGITRQNQSSQSSYWGTNNGRNGNAVENTHNWEPSYDARYNNGSGAASYDNKHSSSYSRRY